MVTPKRLTTRESSGGRSARLLRLQPVQVSLLPVDLGLLGGKSPLDVGVLLLPLLHLIADQRSAEETDGGADAGAGSGIAGRAADNRAETGAAQSSVHRARLARGQWFRATKQPNRQDDRSQNKAVARSTDRCTPKGDLLLGANRDGAFYA